MNKEKTIDQPLIKKAIQHLKSSDEVLSKLIKKHGQCTLSPAKNNPFHALTSSIISQQLSAAAARSIKGKLFSFLASEQFTPEGILKMIPRSFKEAGLSRTKQNYIMGIAFAVQHGELDFASLAECGDEDIISQLVALKGVGRWTAEMFLIFGLGRPDILSLGDAGLKRGFRLAYGLQQTPSADEMISISEPWRPYRSFASWYLWRAID